MLRLAAALEQGERASAGGGDSRRRARTESLTLPPVDGFDAIPGKGIEGRIDGARVVLGNAAMMADAGVSFDAGAAEAAERCGARGRR